MKIEIEMAAAIERDACRPKAANEGRGDEGNAAGVRRPPSEDSQMWDTQLG